MLIKINKYCFKNWIEEIEIDDVKNCFLLSQYDKGGMNRHISTYFAQFKNYGNIYTVEFKFYDFLIDLNFKIGDIHSMGYKFKIKKFIEDHKGQFNIITKNKFFKEYSEIQKLLNFENKIDYGRSNHNVQIVPIT